MLVLCVAYSSFVPCWWRSQLSVTGEDRDIDLQFNYFLLSSAWIDCNHQRWCVWDLIIRWSGMDYDEYSQIRVQIQNLDDDIFSILDLTLGSYGNGLRRRTMCRLYIFLPTMHIFLIYLAVQPPTKHFLTISCQKIVISLAF